MTTSFDVASPAANANRETNRALVADLKARIAESATGCGKAARNIHPSRGKLPARDRIEIHLFATIS